MEKYSESLHAYKGWKDSKIFHAWERFLRDLHCYHFKFQRQSPVGHQLTRDPSLNCILSS